MTVLAQQKAAAWGLPFVARPAQGGHERLLATTAQALLILGGTGWVLRDREGELWFSPGMATVRIKRLRTKVQQPDHLVQLGEVAEGDTVVDGTLGLGSDALVCAHVVGPRGTVLGFEASQPLFLLAQEGLAAMTPFPSSCAIEARFGLARDRLAELATASADVVMLDPMFDRPKGSTPSFDMLRRYAVHAPLDEQTLSEALRVARRWVLVKAGAFGHEFQRLGLRPEVRAASATVRWARLAGRGR